MSFRIRPVEFVAFVGPSGSGKSTIYRLLLGFDQPIPVPMIAFVSLDMFIA